MTGLPRVHRDAVQTSVTTALQGGLPPQDDRFRAAADPGEGGFIRTLAAEAAAHLEGRPADRILAWAASVVPRFVATSSFGAEAVVLLHLLSRVAPHVPVLFLDTGFHFGETLAYRRRLARDLGLTVLDLRPDLSVAQQAERHGDALYRRDPEACCRMRKTVPLRRALARYDGWATGVRRAQTPERAATPVVEARRHDGRWLVKVSPIATWSDDELGDYLSDHDLPRHPLVAEGFRSIGCAPCTQTVAATDDPRSGRWAGSGKSECGLHLDDDGTVTRMTTTPG
ncbi:MAG: phosphoadenylyl-sulfate reductase [Egibacteraceae bacterium]